MLYRKIDNQVWLRGTLSPTNPITPASATENIYIFRLPTGYRPKYEFITVCQGSGASRWTLTVDTSGWVRFARYSDHTGYISPVPNTVWLPIHCTFRID